MNKTESTRPERPPALYSAADPNPSFLYELKLKFFGPAPDDPIMLDLVKQVQHINRYPAKMQTATLMMLATIHFHFLEIKRTTTTLEMAMTYQPKKIKKRT